MPLDPQRTYPVCIGGKRAAPPENCGGLWAYLELLDRHRYHPPVEDIQAVADALERFLKAGTRSALGDLDELREAIDRLKAYQRFQPNHFDRRHINTQLKAVFGRREDGHEAHTTSDGGH